MWSYTFLESMQYVRDSFFNYVEEKRIRRIILISWFIEIIWIFADWKSGNFTVNYWDDVICLIFGVIVERILPWGKDK